VKNCESEGVDLEESLRRVRLARHTPCTLYTLFIGIRCVISLREVTVTAPLSRILESHRCDVMSVQV
jgi:hypothetical protein